MSALLRDTLAKRLFMLMWIALLASHLVGYLMIHALYVPQGQTAASVGATAVPGLPPTPGVPDLRQRANPQVVNQEEQSNACVYSNASGANNAVEESIDLPLQGLFLDYGVRIVIIALAAWLASRWLARPMQSMVAASRSLSASIMRGESPLMINERQGTWEVREAARALNSIAARLHEQFRARTLMVAAISHDLRTPLTRLRMRLDAMSNTADSALLERSINDVREMDKLIDTVLGVFRGDALGSPEVLQDTALVALLQSLTDDLAEQGRKVSFTLPNYPAGADVASVEPAALRRVIGNLVENSLRYAGAAEISIQITAQQIRLIVEDRGPGIPEEHLEAVFEPFYRVDSSRNRNTGGAGLGLFIARQLSLRQGAQVHLVNRVGGGLHAEVLIGR
ncbi:ATP-binding protein [Acidovorax sp. Root402]|uniref:ATP-binding protein n=1 Tax=Acidovorax sp. Root402 TaxID=1736527 RepID=UPI0006F3A5AE|nr:ATP-binding protein [Acidovorax sp. Root402]KQW29984.1 hypothetical protein ASC83_22510 [Acidovorax sp. Root402]